VLSLSRYFKLICFQAFLTKQVATVVSGTGGELPKYAAWVARSPIAGLLEELRKLGQDQKDLTGLTFLGQSLTRRESAADPATDVQTKGSHELLGAKRGTILLREVPSGGLAEGKCFQRLPSLPVASTRQLSEDELAATLGTLAVDLLAQPAPLLHDRQKQMETPAETPACIGERKASKLLWLNLREEPVLYLEVCAALHQFALPMLVLARPALLVPPCFLRSALPVEIDNRMHPFFYTTGQALRPPQRPAAAAAALPIPGLFTTRTGPGYGGRAQTRGVG
jgi:hypothetical protein